MSFVPAEIKMDRCPLTQRFVWKQHPPSSPDGIGIQGRYITYVYNRGENDLADVYWCKFNREVIE
jgi:hypothetical protein